MHAASLIDLCNEAAVNRIVEFAAVARDIDIGNLKRQYEELVKCAPRRHERGKRYLKGRTGITSSGPSSNRREEHLAVALFNASQDGALFKLPDRRPLRIIDYQTPLKARQADRGVGKVDLFAVVDGRRPCVVELKVAGGDTPLRAILEGLAYCAIVEANLANIASEAAEQHMLHLSPVRPLLVVMAPDDYWIEYLNHSKAGRWLTAIAHLLSSLAGGLGLDVHMLALLDAAFEMGLGGRPARLTGNCRIVAVDELASSSMNG